MFRHIVLFKFLHHIDQAVISSFLKELEREKDIMPDIIAISTGRSLNYTESKHYTHAAIMDFKDECAYEQHVNHPYHKALQTCLLPLLDGDLQTAVLRFDFLF